MHFFKRINNRLKFKLTQLKKMANFFVKKHNPCRKTNPTKTVCFGEAFIYSRPSPKKKSLSKVHCNKSILAEIRWPSPINVETIGVNVSIGIDKFRVSI